MKKGVSLTLLLVIVIPLLAVIGAGVRYIVVLQWANARLTSQVASLERRQEDLVARAASAPAPEKAPAPEPARLPPGPRTLTAVQRAAILGELKLEQGPIRDVWFVTTAGDSEAAAYQAEIQGVFEEAGWTVRGDIDSPFPLRPGIFYLMADRDPPSYAQAGLSAFRLAGLEVASGSDYRAFNERKKAEDPDWKGFELADDQAYVIAIGRKPR